PRMMASGHRCRRARRRRDSPPKKSSGSPRPISLLARRRRRRRTAERYWSERSSEVAVAGTDPGPESFGRDSSVTGGTIALAGGVRVGGVIPERGSGGRASGGRYPGGSAGGVTTPGDLSAAAERATGSPPSAAEATPTLGFGRDGS